MTPMLSSLRKSRMATMPLALASMKVVTLAGRMPCSPQRKLSYLVVWSAIIVVAETSRLQTMKHSSSAWIATRLLHLTPLMPP